MTVIRDRFPQVKHWQAAVGIACVGFCVGTVYVTPGGQAVLNLVDHFGASFIVFFLAIAQMLAISWIYGLDNFCRDVRFMLGEKVGHVTRYWRICWGVVTPILMVVILIYTLVTLTPLKYAGQDYPDYVYAVGWCLAAAGLAQLPCWAIWALYQQKGQNFLQRLWGALSPQSNWGPLDDQTRSEWRAFKQLEDEKELARGSPRNFWERLKDALLGQ
ncbi:sodium-dependent nutrient amino acid transporter 1-like [Ctenocephalides felis]|nr:sodium-dependent nutrient amino acid transporter 1-like [Ctenocephalides felis]